MSALFREGCQVTMLKIKRIVVDMEWRKVQEIEFYEGSNPQEIIEFCNKFGIAQNTFKDELIEVGKVVTVGGLNGIIGKDGKFNPF